MAKKETINVKGTEIILLSHKKDDYISLTDMAKYKNAEATGYVISRWLSARYTIDFVGIWEHINNPDFNVVEFNNIKNESGANGFVLTSKQWIEKTNATGIIAKPGRRIHTDAIREHIIPNIVTKEQISYTYAEEADLLNVALFGMTAKQWRDANPDLKGNIRDYATLEQLVVLSNMESINALLIQQQLTQGERLVQLNNVAITQMRSLVENSNLKGLK